MARNKRSKAAKKSTGRARVARGMKSRKPKAKQRRAVRGKYSGR